MFLANFDCQYYLNVLLLKDEIYTVNENNLYEDKLIISEKIVLAVTIDYTN